MNLVERIKAILLQPKSEWPAIEREPGDAGYLFPNYVAIVAAIPAVCTFIGTSIIGYGGYRIGIGLGLVRAVVVYALSLAGVFVVAYIIDFLSGTFGAQKIPENAMRVSAYAPNAALVGGGVQHHSGTGVSRNTRPVQPLSSAHRHCGVDETRAGQSGALYDCRHRLCDHRLGRDFRHHCIVVRRLADSG